MRNYIDIKVALFVIGLNIVNGQEFGNENVEVEYSNVFKNIPTLFEYLLDTLEEKPEVLEKNDAYLFKAVEDDAVDDVTRFKRSVKEIDKNDADLFNAVEYDIDDVTRFERSIEDSEEMIETSLTKDNRMYKDIYLDKDPVINIDETINKNGEEDANNDNVSNTDQIYYVNQAEYNINRNTVDKRSIDEIEKSKEVDTEDTEDVLWLLNEDTEKLFRLTSEEIAEQALKVEEMLENHNSSK